MTDSNCPATEDAPDQKQRHETELIQWLRIPSISSYPDHKDDTARAGQWLLDKFQRAGLKTQWLPTDGHPIVLAETPPVPGAPVALVYGHYDVQPAEPLDLWTTPPFEPTVRDGNLYARGSTDDKGQLLTHVHSVCDWINTGESLPLQVKFLVEGEEEVGSQNLEARLSDLADQLACDCVVISDSGQYADGQPAITYGLRGIATYEIEVQGPAMDLHSGSFGGAVANPAVAICHLISSMFDETGKICISGFYDDVRPIEADERERWKQLPQDESEFAKSIGVDQLFGEPGYTADERRWARPTLEVNGLTSGHQGEGVKTIIPAVAKAKISCRLVPDQDPGKITAAIQAHIDANTIPGTRVTLKADHGAPAMLANTDSPYMAAAAEAIRTGFGVSPVLIREGGSIPIVAEFQKVLRCDCLLLGWGLSDDNAHSPDEKFRLADFHRGIAASRELWKQLGQCRVG
ncbi:dipeptidase [Crateriforma conspicua]|uniref:Succinyl-diaminopimelate desuccinylase n=1 Tax=Crateriforma conspicua TaxID=2527996 RepID=A0A5C6FX08_9PLAN|nr:dipeptidase [Crateriforma conspicua]TWU65563.1 Succinyl-diaminopimelate desuccinylase [Crateriforma conspicua]